MIPKLLSEMPMMKIPDWLRMVKQNQPTQFPLKEILDNSLYYPACGLNGTPVKYLSGHIVSFVYVDYHVSQQEYLADLHGDDNDAGFNGYKSIYEREIYYEDLTPNGWQPPLNPPLNTRLRKELKRGPRFWGHWSVWQRENGLMDDHGAEMFSFLYICGEMSTIYQGLYNRLSIMPLVVAIIQPGGGMGGGWENPENDNSFFKKVVTGNQGGLPKFLLYGGFGGQDFYANPCWQEYSGLPLCLLPERYARLWKRGGT